MQIPLAILLWLGGYVLGVWLPAWAAGGTAWIWAAMQLASHGAAGLQSSSLYVTIAVTIVALLGACLRLLATTARSGEQRYWLREAGLVATCVPLSIILPVRGAAFFLVGLAVLVISGSLIGRHGRAGDSVAPAPWRWDALLRESFPLLAACCFLGLSWAYNAQWLTRGLLVAAGLSLVARALLPVRAGSR